MTSGQAGGTYMCARSGSDLRYLICILTEAKSNEKSDGISVHLPLPACFKFLGAETSPEEKHAGGLRVSGNGSQRMGSRYSMGVGLRPKARALREGNKTLGRAPVQVPQSLSRAWRAISFLKTPRQYLKCSKPSKFAVTLLSFPPPQPYPSLKRLPDVSARPENPREVLGSSREAGPTARRRIRLVPILAVSEQSRRFVRRSSVFTTLRCMIFFYSLPSLSRLPTVLTPQPLSLHSESTDYDSYVLGSGPPVRSALCIRLKDNLFISPSPQ